MWTHSGSWLVLTDDTSMAIIRHPQDGVPSTSNQRISSIKIEYSNVSSCNRAIFCNAMKWHYVRVAKRTSDHSAFWYCEERDFNLFKQRTPFIFSQRGHRKQWKMGYQRPSVVTVTGIPLSSELSRRWKERDLYSLRILRAARHQSLCAERLGQTLEIHDLWCRTSVL